MPTVTFGSSLAPGDSTTQVYLPGPHHCQVKISAELHLPVTVSLWTRMWSLFFESTQTFLVEFEKVLGPGPSRPLLWRTVQVWPDQLMSRASAIAGTAS